MNYIIVVLLIFLILISSILISSSLIEIPSSTQESKEQYHDGSVPQYLHHKSKCFDCEADMINRVGTDGAWMANPSKTFSAETDGIAQSSGDLSGGFLGKTMKYY
jgi:hypothetical protein